MADKVNTEQSWVFFRIVVPLGIAFALYWLVMNYSNNAIDLKAAKKEVS